MAGRDIGPLARGRVAHVVICAAAGNGVDDGTAVRLSESEIHRSCREPHPGGRGGLA